MRLSDQFEFSCECGKFIVTAKRVSQCPGCKRTLDVTAWGKDNTMGTPVKTISEKYEAATK